MPIQSKYYFLKEPLQKVIICGWTTKSTAFEVCQKLNSQEQRKCCLITAFSVLKATSNESIKRKRLNPEIAVKFDLNTRSTKNQCYSDIISSGSSVPGFLSVHSAGGRWPETSWMTKRWIQSIVEGCVISVVERIIEGCEEDLGKSLHIIITWQYQAICFVCKGEI